MSEDVKSETWFVLYDGKHPHDYNMAKDEALMLWGVGLGSPILRFYEWEGAPASFGYSQKIGDIEAATLLRPLVRRTTGGGLVPHDADWTYSLTFPKSHPWYELQASQSYERAHLWIQSAFELLGVLTELAPCKRTELPGQCFAGYEQYDVLQHGRKIAGAAQRRSKTGLLIQGSIQPQPRGIKRKEWQEAMLKVAARDWQVAWIPFSQLENFEQQAQELVKAKYALDEYNRRR